MNALRGGQLPVVGAVGRRVDREGRHRAQEGADRPRGEVEFQKDGIAVADRFRQIGRDGARTARDGGRKRPERDGAAVQAQRRRRRALGELDRDGGAVLGPGDGRDAPRGREAAGNAGLEHGTVRRGERERVAARLRGLAPEADLEDGRRTGRERGIREELAPQDGLVLDRLRRSDLLSSDIEAEAVRR